MPKVFKSQLVENIYPAGAAITKLQFQDQPYLRNKQIFGVELIVSGDMLKSPTNNDLITTADSQIAYLTLYLNDPTNPSNVGEWIQNVPLTLLHRTQNAATDPFVRQMYDLVGQVVYWEKCYITFATALSPANPVSICLNVYFK
jgi:hypothetical protein